MSLLKNEKKYQLTEVLEAMKKIRIKVDSMEYTIQEQIASALTASNIEFGKEVKLSPRNRIDFLIPGGIGVEVKRGKPNTGSVINQLTRYATHDCITQLILVTERSLDVPTTISGKPCETFNLNRLWGIAI